MTESRGLVSVEDAGIGHRILRLFHAPRRAYEPIADGGNWPDWVLPVALVALFWAGHNLAGLDVVAPDPPAAMAGWEQLTEEQRELATRGLEVWRGHGWYSMPVISSFTSLALVALALLGISRWVLRVEVTLRQTLAVKAYASLVAIPQWILLTPLVRAGNSTASPMTFSPATLLANGDTDVRLSQFLSALNVFDLWQAIVVGVGLAVMTQAPQKRAIAVVIILWVAWIALGALAPTPTTPGA